MNREKNKHFEEPVRHMEYSNRIEKILFIGSFGNKRSIKKFQEVPAVSTKKMAKIRFWRYKKKITSNKTSSKDKRHHANRQRLV